MHPAFVFCFQECKGAKLVKDKKVMEVHVDPGMADGQRITFRGEAGDIPGQVRVAYHMHAYTCGLLCIRIYAYIYNAHTC